MDFPPDPTVGAPVLDPTKHGLGLSHVPTGSLATNQACFLIAALAWDLKTWMLNLLQLGDGAVLRFKRFLYAVDLPNGDRGNHWAGQCAAQAACR